MSILKLLIKFPTRSRREKFFSLFDLYLTNMADNQNTSFLLTLDSDDDSMSMDKIAHRLSFYRDFYEVNIEVIYGLSENKIHAVNRDISLYKRPWDILMLTSDDMTPVHYGYDSKIVEAFEQHIPDTDGVLYVPDGYTPLNTLPVLGKKYYERFGYIYNPEYQSFFCDNEFHMVAWLLNKHFKYTTCLIRHDHPIWTGKGNDDLYIRNNIPWAHDEEVFNRRKLINFGIPEKEGKNATEYLDSITKK